MASNSLHTDRLLTEVENIRLVAENELRKQGIFKMSRKDALEKDVCITCGEPAMPKCSTDKGRKEYQITAICEVCFDEMFSEEDR